MMPLLFLNMKQNHTATYILISMYIEKSASKVTNLANTVSI